MSANSTAVPEEEYGMKLGPIKILKDVSPINILTLFFASFFGIAVMSYMNLIWAFILSCLFHLFLMKTIKS